MSRLEGKHILLGITGSIAAYKSAQIARLLVKEGAEVKVVMTELAKQFITPLTMATLTKNPILIDFFDPTNGSWNSHVSLGIWADAYLIAPATANTIGKMANGIADNLLMTSYLSAKCPVAIAPAMDLDMYKHRTTQSNLKQLKEDGVMIIEPESGELASGLVGKGRMEEPEVIVEEMVKMLQGKQTRDLENKKVMITAGPTVEKIDPVRYISNFSSGKMGYSIAEECARRGATVELISGPVSITTTEKNIRVTHVVSADEMWAEAKAKFADCDYAILAAAVADYKPKNTAKEKIKKQHDSQGMTLELIENHDIAAELGKEKKNGQKLIGFALETENESINAEKKLKAKNFDFIVLNSLKDKNAGFQHDTNKVTIIKQNGEKKEFGLKTKKEVAADIVNELTSN